MVYVSLSVYAVKVDIPNANFNIKRNQRHQVIYVENVKNKFQAVEIKIQSRKNTLKGKEVLKETEDFIVVPSQLLLKPKEKIAVTVSWVGDEIPKVEKAYRISAEEVELKSGKFSKKNELRATITFLKKYVYSLYVLPIKIKRGLELTSFEYKYKQQELDIIIKNKGTIHKIFQQVTVDVYSSKKKFERFSVPVATTNILGKSEQLVTLKLEGMLPTTAKKVVLLNVN